MKYWSELADHAETCLSGGFSQHLMEILPYRSIDLLVADSTTCWPVALDRLRSRLVQRLASLSKAWGTVECPFFVLAAIWGLSDGIYLVLVLVSMKPSLAGASITRGGSNNGLPWLTWLARRRVINKEEFLQFYHENLKNNGWWTWGIFILCRTPLFRHLEGPLVLGMDMWSTFRSLCAAVGGRNHNFLHGGIN